MTRYHIPHPKKRFDSRTGRFPPGPVPETHVIEVPDRWVWVTGRVLIRGSDGPSLSAVLKAEVELKKVNLRVCTSLCDEDNLDKRVHARPQSRIEKWEVHETVKRLAGATVEEIAEDLYRVKNEVWNDRERKLAVGKALIHLRTCKTEQDVVVRFRQGDHRTARYYPRDHLDLRNAELFETRHDARMAERGYVKLEEKTDATS